MKPETKCKWFGHKWSPAYISGYYGPIKVKFIGVSCRRCGRGHDELIDTIEKQTHHIYGTRSARYFDDPKYNEKEPEVVLIPYVGPCLKIGDDERAIVRVEDIKAAEARIRELEAEIRRLRAAPRRSEMDLERVEKIFDNIKELGTLTSYGARIYEAYKLGISLIAKVKRQRTQIDSLNVLLSGAADQHRIDVIKMVRLEKEVEGLRAAPRRRAKILNHFAKRACGG